MSRNGAGPESIIAVISMDSGLGLCAPRNDDFGACFTNLFRPAILAAQASKQVPMSAQRSIVIGGGAFAGLALALALRQGLGADIPVIVADPALAVRPSRDPRATAIVAACRRLFEALGVWGEVADNAQYYVFPNFMRHSFSLRDRRIAYRFMPRENDPTRSWFDIYFWEYGAPTELDASGQPVPSVKTMVVPAGKPLAEVPELSWLGPVLDQDQVNMPRVQAGLRAGSATKPGITLSHYQESRIRHYHRTLEQYIEEGASDGDEG